MLIPRVIHQTCRDKRDLPPVVLASIAQMRALNPGWEYRLYDNKDVDNFVRTHYGPDVFELFKRINPNYGPAIADVFRYLLVHRIGGVYLDIKSTMLKPLDEVLRETDRFLLSQWRNRPEEDFAGWGIHPELADIPGGEFQQWQVTGVPGHPFLARVIARVLNNLRTYDPDIHGTGHIGVLRTTGPICYTLAIAPHLHEAEHRFVDTRELGFQYTIYPQSAYAHQSVLFGRHYTRLSEPVVREQFSAPS